jgi:hypothetical protein
VIVGSEAGDTIDGNSGNDLICGLAGDDTLRAGPANDLLDGGPGNPDDCDGEAGTDTARSCEILAGVRHSIPAAPPAPPPNGRRDLAKWTVQTTRKPNEHETPDTLYGRWRLGSA